MQAGGAGDTVRGGVVAIDTHAHWYPKEFISLLDREAAANGGLAILRTGDKVRIDLNKGSANILISEEELKKRRAELKAKGGFPYPPNQTPWQEIYRRHVTQLQDGGCLDFAINYQRIDATHGVPRDNH